MVAGAGQDTPAARCRGGAVAGVGDQGQVPVADGVQWSLPVATLKLAAGGLPVIDQVSVSPSGSIRKL